MWPKNSISSYRSKDMEMSSWKKWILAALLTISQRWKVPERPSVRGKTNKRRYLHAVTVVHLKEGGISLSQCA